MLMRLQRFWDTCILQKHKNLDIENGALFFLQIKKFVYYTSTATLLQKSGGGGGNL